MEVYKVLPLEVYNKLVKDIPSKVFDSKSILENINLLQRPRAEGIINILSKNLTWNEVGEIKYSDKSVSGSDILKLISFVTKTYPVKTEPKGLSLFFEAIKEERVPRQLLSKEVRTRLYPPVVKRSSKKVKPRWIPYKYIK